MAGAPGGISVNLTLLVVLAIVALVVFLLAPAYIIAVLALIAGTAIIYVIRTTPGLVVGGIIDVLGIVLAIVAYTSHGLAL